MSENAMTTPANVSPRQVGASVQGAHVDWTSVIWFTILAYALGWLVFASQLIGVPFGLVSIIGMFAPGVAAVIVRLVRSEGFADMGLRLHLRRHVSTYIWAYVVPVAMIATSLLLAVVLGRQHYAPTSTYAQWMPILILGALTLDTIVTMVLGAGEELGWRGHLLVRLAPLGGVRAALIVGVIWGIWHAPLIVPGQGWLGALFFLGTTIPLSIILAWLRFRSGSVWPAVLAHATFNAVGALIVLMLSTDQWMIAPPAGLLGILPVAVFAVWLVATGRLRVTADSLRPTTPTLSVGHGSASVTSAG